MEGFSFISDGELFAADVARVQKVAGNIPVTPAPAAPDAVAGIANMKGRIVTVLILSSLLGRVCEKNCGRGIRTVNAVVFKPFMDGENQMGLVIEKPGGLISIDENKIIPPSMIGITDEQFCISGAVEIDGKLYRIVNIDAIVNLFKSGGAISADTAFSNL